MNMESLNKKIQKKQEKVDIYKAKYDEASKKYTEASKELKELLEIKRQEEEREKYSMLEKICTEKNVDIQTVADVIKSGKMDVLLEAMEQIENQKENAGNGMSV